MMHARSVEHAREFDDWFGRSAAPCIAGVQAIAISLDGAKPETHDQFRGEEGAFNKALNGAQACKQAGLPFQFNAVIRKPCLSEVPEIVKPK